MTLMVMPFFYVDLDLVLRLHCIQFEPECSAFSKGAVDTVADIVERKDLFDYRKSKAASCSGTDHVGTGFVIALPDVIQIFRRDAAAVIGDGDSDLTALFLQDHIDSLVFAAEFHCI